MNYLFSYGTLQMESVQLDTFGRLLTGATDSLSGYVLETVTITDQAVINSSGTDQHPIIKHTGNNDDIIEGTLYQVSDAELLEADKYEVADYERKSLTFDSGKAAFVYAPAD